MAEYTIDKFTYDGNTYKLQDNISGYNAYTLPIASASTLGGIKIGTGLTIDSSTGVLNATGTSMTIDTALSTTSTNPVQNKVITDAFNSTGIGVFTDSATNKIGLGISVSSPPELVFFDDNLATNENSGFMSYTDKSKLDRIGNTWYGTCSTTASTAAKVVTCSNFSLVQGATISILFSTANTAATPTLNVNSTGAKSIYVGSSTPSATTNVLKWSANTLLTFIYDGTYFRYISSVSAGSVIPSRGANTWYGACSTTASTAAKTSTIDNFVLTKGAVVILQMTAANTVTNAAITLNINSTGAKTIYFNNAATSATNNLLWDVGEILIFTYDGTYWRAFQNTNTTYLDFIGATETTTGTHGLVPSPPANGMQYLLYGDGSFHGTWLEYAADSRYVKLVYNDGTEDICSGAAQLPLASTTTPGLINANDQAKLNYLSTASIWYGTCNTVTATADKEITLSSSYWPLTTYTLKTGSIINVFFNYPNTTTTPTINVNSTGAKPIRIGSAAPNGTDNQLMWDAGTLISFIYDEAGDSGRGAYRYLTSVTYGTAYTQEYTNTEIDELDLEGESAAGIGGISLVPIGTILDFAGSVAPNGYLLCDGSAVSRTDYAGLFAVIGTTWGSGDGSTTFNVPDLRGRSAIGAGTGSYTGATARNLGAKGGSESMQQHNHLPNSNTDWKFIAIKPASGVAGQLDAQAYSSGSHRYVEGSTESGRLTYYSTTTNTGEGNSGNMSPFVVVTKIIKAI